MSSEQNHEPERTFPFGNFEQLFVVVVIVFLLLLLLLFNRRERDGSLNAER